MYACEGSEKRCAVYDTETDSWTELEETQHNHEGGAVVFKDYFPMILGWECSREVEKYIFGGWNVSSVDMPDDLSDPFAFIMGLPQTDSEDESEDSCSVM